MAVMDGALERLEALLAQRLGERPWLRESVAFVAAEDVVAGLLWVCRADPRSDDPEAVDPVFQLFWSDEEERWLVSGPDEQGWGYGETTGCGGCDVDGAFAAAESLGLLWAGVDLGEEKAV